MNEMQHISYELLFIVLCTKQQTFLEIEKANLNFWSQGGQLNVLYICGSELEAIINILSAGIFHWCTVSIGYLRGY